MPSAGSAAGRAVLLAVAAALAMPSRSQACSVCFGIADKTLSNAMNSGIFALLAVTGVVLGWFVAVIVTLRRRAKRWEERKAALHVVEFGHSGPSARKS